MMIVYSKFNPLKEMEAIKPKSILMNAKTFIKNHNKAVIKIKFMLVFLFYDHSRFKTKSITNCHVFFSFCVHLPHSVKVVSLLHSLV